MSTTWYVVVQPRGENIERVKILSHRLLYLKDLGIILALGYEEDENLREKIKQGLVVQSPPATGSLAWLFSL